MRGLLEKYPLGYEGYLREKALAVNKQAFAANAGVGVQLAVEVQPATGVEPAIANGTVPGSASGATEPPTKKVSSVVT